MSPILGDVRRLLQYRFVDPEGRHLAGPLHLKSDSLTMTEWLLVLDLAILQARIVHDEKCLVVQSIQAGEPRSDSGASTAEQASNNRAHNKHKQHTGHGGFQTQSKVESNSSIRVKDDGEQTSQKYGFCRIINKLSNPGYL